MPKCAKCRQWWVPFEGHSCADCQPSRGPVPIPVQAKPIPEPKPQPLGQMDRGATGQYCQGITWEDINLKNWVRR